MSTIELTDTAEELYRHVPNRYRRTLNIMFERVPAARAHFHAGNVHTAFRLLREEENLRINRKWNMSKEYMLTLIMGSMPSMYASADLDPDFEPEL